MNAWNIELLPCRQDNYCVLLHEPEQNLTVAIDAPEEQPMLAALERHGWHLDVLLITHHHGDHTAACPAMKQRFGTVVYGPAEEAERIAGLDHALSHGQQIDLAGHAVEIISTPGHTLGGIAYYMPDDALLFAGDTLFALGCGRLFEGTAVMMWRALQRLRALPGATQVYCGHEYTLANAQFARAIDPHNALLQKRFDTIRQLREMHQPTLPTTLGEELATNPFLRADHPDMAQAVGLPDALPEQVFAELRRRKDNF